MIRAFFRAYLIVTLTAANVSLIADRNWGLMFLTGTALSFVWVSNTRATVGTGKGWQIAYALGAGCGTLTGVWLASSF